FSLLSLTWTRAKHFANRALPCLRGWSDPTILLGSQRLPKTGSLQPIPVFCPCPNRMSRRAQPLRSQQLRVTLRVTRTVTVKVICVFHVSVTVSRSRSERRAVRMYQKAVEKHGTVRPQLRELCSQVCLAK